LERQDSSRQGVRKPRIIHSGRRSRNASPLARSERPLKVVCSRTLPPSVCEGVSYRSSSVFLFGPLPAQYRRRKFTKIADPDAALVNTAFYSSTNKNSLQNQLFDLFQEIRRFCQLPQRTSKSEMKTRLKRERIRSSSGNFHCDIKPRQPTWKHVSSCCCSFFARTDDRIDHI
jgi:hypothetical protein